MSSLGEVSIQDKYTGRKFSIFAPALIRDNVPTQVSSLFHGSPDWALDTYRKKNFYLDSKFNPILQFIFLQHISLDIASVFTSICPCYHIPGTLRLHEPQHNFFLFSHYLPLGKNCLRAEIEH